MENVFILKVWPENSSFCWPGEHLLVKFFFLIETLSLKNNSEYEVQSEYVKCFMTFEKFSLVTII